MKFVFPLILLIFSSIIFSSCSEGTDEEESKANNFEISGTVKGASGKKIILVSTNPDENKRKLQKQLLMEKGIFY